MNTSQDRDIFPRPSRSFYSKYFYLRVKSCKEQGDSHKEVHTALKYPPLWTPEKPSKTRVYSQYASFRKWQMPC